MDNELVQNLRYKLQKRTRRLNSLEFVLFHSGLKQYWGFLQSNEIIKGVLDSLANIAPECDKVAEKIIAGETLVFDNELESVGTAYFVIKRCAESKEQSVEMHIGRRYKNGTNFSEHIDGFREVFLEPLYDYMDEQLDDQRATLAMLRKYKHSCEWFQREELNSIWKTNTQKGEKNLTLNLYQYLFEQGVSFSIEPKSASGAADLVGAQTGAERLIADAKVFSAEKGKRYLISAFNQVYTYTLDYNQAFGYLVIFKTCPEDLKLSFATHEQSIPCVRHNNKTIFFLVIDICDTQESASKRGVLQTIELSEDELTRPSTMV